MSPAVKFFLGLALVVLLLLASPFLVEAGIRRYDRKRDPYTGPAAVVMEAGAARQGLNRRLFHEVRFATTGLGLRLRASGLPRESAESFARPVRGSVRVLRLGGPDDAAPGPRPPASATELGAFDFRLEPVSMKAVLPETRSDAGLGGAPAPTPRETFEVLCDLVPATPEQRPAADHVGELRHDALRHGVVQLWGNHPARHRRDDRVKAVLIQHNENPRPGPAAHDSDQRSRASVGRLHSLGDFRLVKGDAKPHLPSDGKHGRAKTVDESGKFIHIGHIVERLPSKIPLTRKGQPAFCLYQ